MSCDFTPTVGCQFTFRTDPSFGFSGRVEACVLEVRELERIRFSWKSGRLDTEVEFRLIPVDPDHTTLQVVHRGFRGFGDWFAQAVLSLGWRTLFRRRLPESLSQTLDLPRDTL